LITRTNMLTLVAICAAAYAALSLLPGFPIIGLPSSEIDLARSLEPAYGLILGPVLGPSSALLGAVVGKLIVGDSIGLLFAPLAIVSAFVAAALNRRTVLGVRGWMIALIITASLIACWYATPAGRSVPIYPIPHVIGLVLLLVFRGRITDDLQSSDKKKLSREVMLASYPATISGQMLGNLIFLFLFKPEPAFFLAVAPVTLAERIVLTLVATAISVPLILAVRRSPFKLGSGQVGDSADTGAPGAAEQSLPGPSGAGAAAKDVGSGRQLPVQAQEV